MPVGKVIEPFALRIFKGGRPLGLFNGMLSVDVEAFSFEGIVLFLFLG